MLSNTYISLNNYDIADCSSSFMNSEDKTEETYHEEYVPEGQSSSKPKRKRVANNKKTVRSKKSGVRTASPNSSKAYKKTPEQVAFLEQQFEKDPQWSRKSVQI